MALLRPEGVMDGVYNGAGVNLYGEGTQVWVKGHKCGEGACVHVCVCVNHLKFCSREYMALVTFAGSSPLCHHKGQVLATVREGNMNRQSAHARAAGKWPTQLCRRAKHAMKVKDQLAKTAQCQHSV